MGHTMSTRIRKLTDLEIDEVSLVDRPANQHGLVAFAKAHGEDTMTIYDAEGVEVYEDELEPGDIVYAEDGTELEVVVEYEDDTSAELQSGHDYEEEPVGKSSRAGFTTHSAREAAGAFGGTRGVRGAASRAGDRVFGNGTQARNRKRVAGGAAAATAGGGGYAAHRVNKSLGQSVYEELSKALTTDDHAQVISKMADEVEVYKSQAEYAMNVAEQLAEQAELEEFTEIAKGYGLPTDPRVLGSILKSAAETMSDAELRELDRLLTSQGELYEELGSGLGTQNSEIMGEIEARALEMVGKADGISESEAVVALFEANPAYYDEYLSEKG